MGMQSAFSPELADFSRMSDMPLVISTVLHNKTHIELTETGTRAAAATIIEMEAGESLSEPEPYKTVYLDRPFVYMIVDTENCLPVFMGTVQNIGK